MTDERRQPLPYSQATSRIEFLDLNMSDADSDVHSDKTSRPEDEVLPIQISGAFSFSLRNSVEVVVNEEVVVVAFVSISMVYTYSYDQESYRSVPVDVVVVTHPSSSSLTVVK